MPRVFQGGSSWGGRQDFEIPVLNQIPRRGGPHPTMRLKSATWVQSKTWNPVRESLLINGAHSVLSTKGLTTDRLPQPHEQLPGGPESPKPMMGKPYGLSEFTQHQRVICTNCLVVNRMTFLFAPRVFSPMP